MTKINCTRRIEFDAGHRVMEHEGKCKYVHGHRYVIEAAFEGDGLDTLGRVIDFGVIKKILGDWVDANWDHTMVLWDRDKPLGDAVSTNTNQKIYYLPYNPTAENMAKYLFEKVCPTLFKDKGVQCVHLRLYETPNGYADAYLN